jgi:iduronate 2-sulfatase
MRRRLLPLLLAAATAGAAERPNVLFIAIDDLRNDLGLYGVAHARTPQLDAFAATARPFSHHYVQVPTCGASRYTLWRGKLPDRPVHLGNGAIAATHPEWAGQSLPAWFRRHGYTTHALGKLTHHPGGRTGKNWAEGPVELPEAWTREWLPAHPWGTPQALMHGYANGAPRVPGKTPPWEAFDGPDEAYPDAHIAAAAVTALHELTAQAEPWFFAVGFFKPHLPFAAPARWHALHADPAPPGPSEAASRRAPDPSSWHKSGELTNNYGDGGRSPFTDPDYARRLRQAYAACVSYVDAQVGRVLDALAASPAAARTVVVVWGDHGFLLGEHGVWGKHCLYEDALRAPLLIRAPGLTQPGRISPAVVETVDIYPTLADLCGLPAPEGLEGQSLRAQLDQPGAPSAKAARAWWGQQRSVRTDRHRLIAHPAGPGHAEAFELFDHGPGQDPYRNRALDQPERVAELRGQLPPQLRRP